MNGRAPIEYPNGTNPVAAFFAEAHRVGWKPDDSWRGKVSGAVARASRSGIEAPHIVAALEECARRRTLTHFSNILADVQVGAPIGRPPAPFAPREDDAGAALRRVFADAIPPEEEAR